MPAAHKIQLKGAEQIREAIERLRGAVEGLPTTLRALVRYKFEHAAEMYRVKPKSALRLGRVWPRPSDGRADP